MGKIDGKWLDMWAGHMEGRQMRNIDELCGKEIADLTWACERYSFDVIEERRRQGMYESDKESVWWEVCPRHVESGECAHMLHCRMLHCYRR